jgi:hypothetical protein
MANIGHRSVGTTSSRSAAIASHGRALRALPLERRRRRIGDVSAVDRRRPDRAADRPVDDQAVFYLLRLAAFVIIVVAIIDKNRR